MNDRSVLRRFAQGMGAERHMGYLRAKDVENYFNQLSAEQKPTSYNKVRQRVSMFLNYWHRHGWVRDDLECFPVRE